MFYVCLNGDMNTFRKFEEKAIVYDCPSCQLGRYLIAIKLVLKSRNVNVYYIFETVFRNLPCIPNYKTNDI